MYLDKEITQEAKSLCKIQTSQEVPFAPAESGPQLTKGNFVLSYHGDLEGEGHLEELKVYFTAKRAEIYGLQRFTGKIGDRLGSFVLSHRGRWMNGEIAAKMTVVPGSATGALKGLRGELTLRTGPATEFLVHFRYHFF